MQFPSARHTTERAQLQAFIITPYPRDSNLLAAQLQHSLTPRERRRPTRHHAEYLRSAGDVRRA
jgi:hypothetical protein